MTEVRGKTCARKVRRISERGSNHPDFAVGGEILGGASTGQLESVKKSGA